MPDGELEGSIVPTGFDEREVTLGRPGGLLDILLELPRNAPDGRQARQRPGRYKRVETAWVEEDCELIGARDRHEPGILHAQGLRGSALRRSDEELLRAPLEGGAERHPSVAEEPCRSDGPPAESHLFQLGEVRGAPSILDEERTTAEQRRSHGKEREPAQHPRA